MIDRVPFEIAIGDDQLLKPRWIQLSKPQQVILKSFYGLKLSDEELIYWSMLQGGATYDELGFVKSITMVPYEPKEYSRLVAILGRRSGKTDMVVSTAAAYELTLGGHKQHVKAGQEYKALFLAQTEPDAKTNMNFIKLALEESPRLKKLLVDAKDQVASEIRFRDGLKVEPSPANKAIGRGHAIPVVICDESAFWYTDPKAANPDFEVLRAVSYSQLQFPFPKIFIPSTPYAEQGILWQAHEAGTQGVKVQCAACRAAKRFVCEHPSTKRLQYENTLVVHASTAAMENPLITKRRLVEIRNEDPDAFPRESLAQFIKVISGWLDTNKVDLAVQSGVTMRLAYPRIGHIEDEVPFYVATMDPAFRKDSFAFTIGHMDAKQGWVQDYLQYWEPQPGAPLKPGDVLDDIKQHLAFYKVNNVYSDQHQLESLQELAQLRGFTITGHDFTGTSKAKICGSFRILLYQERIKLLDHEEQKKQFHRLQQKVSQSGAVQIAAPLGEHDDLAMVTMLNARIASGLFNEVQVVKEKPLDIETDHVKMFYAQIERKKREAAQAEEEDWD